MCLGNAWRMAGNFRGVKGAAKTYTPVDLWNVEIKTLNKAFELDLEDGHNCVVFVRSGRRVCVCGCVRVCARSRVRGSHEVRRLTFAHVQGVCGWEKREARRTLARLRPP